MSIFKEINAQVKSKERDKKNDEWNNNKTITFLKFLKENKNGKEFHKYKEIYILLFTLIDEA